MECSEKPHKVRIRYGPVRSGQQNDGSRIRWTGSQRRKHEGESLHPCGVCSRAYTTMHHLNAHMKLKHNTAIMADMPRKKKSVGCEEENCGTVCENMDELRSHMEVVHPLVLYECVICRYKGVIKHMFQRHMTRVHEKVNDKICEYCGKSFLKSYHLRVHRMRHHGVEDPTLKIIKCDEPGCKYQTFALNILETHKRKHDKGKPFGCKLCSKKLKTEKNLQKHMRKIHERIRPFICEICGVDYGEESELKLHMVRHDEARHFCCDMCDYTSYSKSILESHMYVKHKIKMGRYQDMLKCEQCDFETPNPGKLEEHTNAHKNIRPHQCDECDKAFFTKPTLKEHKKWVHNAATLQCPYCVFKAPVNSHLKKHIRVLHTHRDVKPYKCYYCDYRCNVSGNCRKHIMQKHKGYDVKWVKVCDTPLPSLTARSDEVNTITNTGNTYTPKRLGKKKSKAATAKSKAAREIIIEPVNAGQDTDSKQYVQDLSGYNPQQLAPEQQPQQHLLGLTQQQMVMGEPSQGYSAVGAGVQVQQAVGSTQDIDAASTLAKLSVVESLMQAGGLLHPNTANLQQGGVVYGGAPAVTWGAPHHPHPALPAASTPGPAHSAAHADMNQPQNMSSQADLQHTSMSRAHHTVAPSYAPLTVAANVVNPTSYFDTLTPMAQATLQNYMAHMQAGGQNINLGVLPNFNMIAAAASTSAPSAATAAVHYGGQQAMTQQNQGGGGGAANRSNMPDVVPNRN